jgi:predicted GH43/DUF377 family glycosyl hydrolase
VQEVLPSFAAQRVDFIAPPGYAAMNPSIARDGAELWLLQRTVNYRLTDTGHYLTDGEAPITTRNFLLALDPALRVQSATEIAAPRDWPAPQYPLVRGFEDCRLYAREGELWCTATVRERNADGWCEIVVARIADVGTPACELADWRVLGAGGEPRHEKNWMPVVGAGEARFVYGLDPTRVVDAVGATYSEAPAPIAAEHLRGSSQAIAFDDGWLALVHEAALVGNARHYLHRLVFLDAAFRLAALSPPFKLSAERIEFAAGLAFHPDGRLIASYGVADRESWLASFDAADVRKLLAAGAARAS